MTCHLLPKNGPHYGRDQKKRYSKTQEGYSRKPCDKTNWPGLAIKTDNQADETASSRDEPMYPTATLASKRLRAAKLDGRPDARTNFCKMKGKTKLGK